MKTFQVSMPDEVTADWEQLVNAMMAKLGGATKGEAMTQLLGAARKELAADLPANTAPYVTAINGYMAGITSQVAALVDVCATQESTFAQRQADALAAINANLTAKSEALAAAIVERDEAAKKLEEVQAELADEQQKVEELTKQCEALVIDNKALQASFNDLAAALRQQSTK